MKPELLPEAVRRTMSHHWPCELCGRLTLNRGVFMPADDEHARVVGLEPPQGKVRVRIYAMCDKHRPCADTAEKIESKWEREHKSGKRQIVDAIQDIDELPEPLFHVPEPVPWNPEPESPQKP